VLELLKSTHVNGEDNEAEVTQRDGEALDGSGDGRAKKRVAPMLKSGARRTKKQKVAHLNNGGLGDFAAARMTENASGTRQGELIGCLCIAYMGITDRVKQHRPDIPEHIRFFESAERS
jgi:hypothetical protein